VYSETTKGRRVCKECVCMCVEVRVSLTPKRDSQSIFFGHRERREARRRYGAPTKQWRPTEESLMQHRVLSRRLQVPLVPKSKFEEGVLVQTATQERLGLASLGGLRSTFFDHADVDEHYLDRNNGFKAFSARSQTVVNSKNRSGPGARQKR